MSVAKRHGRRHGGGSFSRRLAAFGAWRRSRPFWGGLFLVLAGLELLAIPLSGVLIKGAVKLVIYIGIGGVFGVLIGVLLITAGLVLWINPTHRVFYGIAGIVLGILSFPASNLGGFFIGMFLAIIGGANGVAWTPARLVPGRVVPPPAGPAGDTRQADLDLITDAPRDRPDSGPGQRLLAVAAMPALLLAGMSGASGTAKQAAVSQSALPRAAGTCVLWVICWPDPSPSPGATPGTSASPSASPTSPGSSSGTGAKSPSSSGSASAAKAAANKTKQAKPASTVPPPPGLVAASSTSVLSARSASLSGFSFVGITSLPLDPSGTEQAMEFTASSATLSDANVSVTESSHTSDTTSPKLMFDGGMTLFATKLCGTIYGVVGPVCFTPTTVDAVLLKIANVLTSNAPLQMTNVTTYQPVAVAPSLQTGALRLDG
jgi:hypothetical protein